MVANTGVQNYLNTLIFCVVAKTITVIVLGSLFLQAVRPYAVFLLTIELGLVTIVIWSLIKIRNYDKRMAKEAEDIINSAVNSVSCPEYYVRSVDEEDIGTVCLNGYLTPDEKYEYKFKGDASIDAIPIDEMFRKQTLEGACTIIDASPSLNSIPWTDIRSKCAIL